MIPNGRAFDGKTFVEADGKTFYRCYGIERQGKFRLIFRVVAIDSPYKQGIAFALSNKSAFKGTIHINGENWPIDKRKRMVHVIPVSLETPYNQCVLDVDVREGSLRIANASNFLDDYPEMIEKISAQTGRSREQFRGSTFTSGFSATNLYGNAFWMEQISENCFRFHCNDHKMDDDFDDLIIELEIIDLQ